MAFSSSIKRAQAIKLCELCNEDSIKWRCVDCEMCLCEKCKTFHLRVPATAKHQIVTIATPIQNVPRRIITDNIPCKNHLTRMTCMFCETCNCLVCPECISTSHTKHQLIPIEKALDGKMEKLKSTQAKTIDSIKRCDSKSTEIQHLIPKFNSIFDKSISKIKEREQELKDVISKFSKELQDNVEAERSKVKSRFTRVERQVDETRKKLKDLKQDLEAALASNQGQVIFETIPTEPNIEFDCLANKVESFIPVEEATKQIQALFGSFKEMTIPTSSAEFGFEVLRTCTTDLPDVQQVIPLDETTAWIICFTKEKSVMRKVTIQDNNIVATNEIAMEIYDMALTSDNEILMTVNGESDVKLMTKTGAIKTFLTVKPLLPTAIHVTSDNHIIVGVVEPGATFTPSDQSQRAIMVFDMEGKQKQEYQFDENRQRLFTVPSRITTNNNQDILVIDRTSRESGRVVTLDREGGLRWIYKGHPKINGTTHFCPRGITTTAAGYIIVGDVTHALHVLSENGDVMTCKVLYDMGIMCPLGLNIDKGGKLWVGCHSGKESGAKLHIVKLII